MATYVVTRRPGESKNDAITREIQDFMQNVPGWEPKATDAFVVIEPGETAEQDEETGAIYSYPDMNSDQWGDDS